MMLMMLAVHSKNRRRDYADVFRFLRHLPSESMTMMLMMLVLFVCDHLCQALVRLAASYPRAFFKRADDAAFLDRLPAKSGQHGIIMHLGRQRPQASTIDIASWFEVACRKQASFIRIIVILFWTERVSIRQHHQHRFPSLLEQRQQASSAASAFHSGWQLVRKVSIHSMTLLLVGHLHTSRDDADDARCLLRKPKKRLC